MKKIISLSILAFLTTGLYAETDASSTQAQIDQLKAQVKKLEKKEKRNSKKISKVNILANNDNLKFNVDFRTAYDYISYKTADGDKSSNGVFSNRLWLNMAYAPTDNISFYSTLAYYKVYGQATAPQSANSQYDWIVNENAGTTNNVRIKEAFWLYKNDTFLGMDIPWTASVGRRPSTDGLLVNYREDQKAKSAIGHNINMEFDGGSFNYNLSNVTGVSGMALKFCIGRGMSNTYTRYSSNGKDYSKKDGWDNTDLVGVLFKPYDDGQYSLHTVWFKSFNMPGYDSSNAYKQVGDISGGAASFISDGIGDGISDMLDDTTVFASFAYSKTDPQTSMLGSKDSKTGTSVYVGANWPCQLMDDARVGVEYNHGSKYWRSFTYGEDTLAGSKLAVRGDAYELFFNKELIGKKLTAQIRYTYMDYKYNGSNAFFGNYGTPTSVTGNDIEKAQDIRAYIRYRY